METLWILASLVGVLLVLWAIASAGMRKAMAEPLERPSHYGRRPSAQTQTQTQTQSQAGQSISESPSNSEGAA